MCRPSPTTTQLATAKANDQDNGNLTNDSQDDNLGNWDDEDDDDDDDRTNDH